MARIRMSDKNFLALAALALLVADRMLGSITGSDGWIGAPAAMFSCALTWAVRKGGHHEAIRA